MILRRRANKWEAALTSLTPTCPQHMFPSGVQRTRHWPQTRTRLSRAYQEPMNSKKFIKWAKTIHPKNFTASIPWCKYPPSRPITKELDFESENGLACHRGRALAPGPWLKRVITTRHHRGLGVKDNPVSPEPIIPHYLGCESWFWLCLDMQPKLAKSFYRFLCIKHYRIWVSTNVLSSAVRSEDTVPKIQ